MTARLAGGTPLVSEVAAPQSVLRTLAGRWPDRYPALLESVAAGELGRYTILFGPPVQTLSRQPGGAVQLTNDEPSRATHFLDALAAAWANTARSVSARLDDGTELPFCGGWLVLLGYEVAAEVEPSLSLPASDLPFDALALRIDSALIFDSHSQRLYAVAEAGRDVALRQRVDDALSCHTGPVAGRVTALRISEEPADLYLRRIARAQAYVAAGDVYQANLSRRWRAELEPGWRPLALYEQLCAANPAPFAALLQWQGVTVASSSPERLLQVKGRAISTRPIAGTRPRTHAPNADQREALALVAHPKERAEHVMLIDLERNDLGRVCEAGSVTVDEFMVTETYAHVHHIVSSVRGSLRRDVTVIDALRALFPGGTITGCPKVRCMEIIAELEGEARGFYTGSLGYFSCEGGADFNILIRTLTACGDRVELRAGAGIVADSNAARELEETRAKARGLLLALDTADPTTSS
ncbi:MAG: aminodeoxychorismate synthase component I [Steroidobacteraceae bacterium]